MRIKHNLSAVENFLALVSQKAIFPYSVGQLTLGNPTAITPNAGNGQRNTSVVLTRVAGDTYTVRYTRATITSNRTTAGNKVFVTSQDTHETIQAKILARLDLKADQILFTNPTSLPPPEGTANYTLTVITNSYLYAPSIVTIVAQNQSSQ